MGGPRWDQDRWGTRFVVGYVVLTLLAVAASTDAVLSVVPGHVSPVAVPWTIYIFGLLGALTYAFTSLTFGSEKDRHGVVQLGLRVLAALPLAGAVFLFSGFFVDEGANSPVVGGLAFFAGLYVRLTLRSLGKLAERLYGGVDGRSRRAEVRTAAERALGRAKRLLDGDGIEGATRGEVEDAVETLETTLADWDAPAAEVESATERLEGLLPDPEAGGGEDGNGEGDEGKEGDGKGDRAEGEGG